jgi:peroxiredoxin
LVATVATLTAACGGGGNARDEDGLISEGTVAPDFTLAAANGDSATLSDYIGKQNVLLYFSMGSGWEPCLTQIVDLEQDEAFAAMDVALLKIAVDPLEDLEPEADRLSIQTPMLSDEDFEVVNAYGLPLTHGGEPGHIFVLVGTDGRVKWVKDYGAPENGGLMYVEVEELRQEVSTRVWEAPPTNVTSTNPRLAA